jgi:hypothetical protein
MLRKCCQDLGEITRGDLREGRDRCAGELS